MVAPPNILGKILYHDRNNYIIFVIKTLKIVWYDSKMYMNMFMVFTWYKIQNSKIHKYCVLTFKKSFISILIDSETVFTKLNFRNMYFSILSFSHSSQEFLNFWINLLFSKYPTDIMPKYISQITHSGKNLLIAKMNVKSFNVQWFISLHSVMQYSDINFWSSFQYEVC